MRFPAICRFTSIRRFPAICRLGMHVAFAKHVVLPKCISMAEMEAVEAAEVEGEVVEIGAENGRNSAHGDAGNSKNESV